MNTINQPRRSAAAPDVTLGVRPGAGVLGLAKAEPASRATAPQGEPSSQGTLIVGEGIQVKGQIQSCTNLVVEGKVEASLEAVQLTVLQGGLYDGKAVVERARIGGTFSGELTVNGLLTVEAGGRVSGTLRYRELAIEQGGRLSGDVDLVTQDKAAEEAGHKSAPRQAAKLSGKLAGERVVLEETAAR
ncbi:MAG: polymer-forming cytoskeletal protein [Kiloniellaceae bacterium]